MDNSYEYLGICEKTQDKDEQDKKGLRLHHQLGLSELRRKREEANFKEEDRREDVQCRLGHFPLRALPLHRSRSTECFKEKKKEDWRNL